MPIERINPGRRLSKAVIHGDTVYIAGLVAEDTTADVAGQTRQILTKLEALLLQVRLRQIEAAHGDGLAGGHRIV